MLTLLAAFLSCDPATLPNPLEWPSTRMVTYTMYVHVHAHVHVWVHASNQLTDDDRKDDEDYDDEDNPEFHVLPPQLPLEASGRPLEHVSILVQVLCKWGRVAEVSKDIPPPLSCHKTRQALRLKEGAH